MVKKGDSKIPSEIPSWGVQDSDQLRAPQENSLRFSYMPEAKPRCRKQSRKVAGEGMTSYSATS